MLIYEHNKVIEGKLIFKFNKCYIYTFTIKSLMPSENIFLLLSIYFLYL